MAMVLRTSRLRLTQAIYFGFPPSAVGSGFIKADGSVPLTNDWDAGNFKISSRNSTDWYNVVAYGANPTGADVPPGSTRIAIQNAISACEAAGGGVVYFPGGTFTVTQVGAAVPFVITAGNVYIQGAGRTATNINFVPVGGGPVFQFNTAGVPINYCGIQDISFTSPDAAIQKTMVLARDLNMFAIERVSNTAGTFWTGANSIGVQFMGRQELRMRDCQITADLPVRISVNPNLPGINQISFDHSSIEACDFNVTSPLTNQSITVDDGCMISNCAFEKISMTMGNGGFKFDNTTQASVSFEVKIDNIRTEQSVSNTGYAVDITATTGGIQSLNVSNVRCDPVTNCIRLALATWPRLSGISYGGIGTFLNLSGTVSNLLIENSFRQSGSTITDASVNPTGIDLISGGNPGVTTFGTLTLPSGAPPLSAGSASQFRVNSSGQLGLAGATPDQALTFGSGAFTHWLGGNPVLYNIPVAPAGTTVTFQSAASGAIGFPANGAQVRLESDASDNGVIRFATTQAGVGNFERVTISKEGYTGFATTSPTRTIDLAGVQRYRGQAAPAVSEANSGTIYFDSATNKLKASLNGGAYVDIIGSGGLTGSGTTGQVAYWDGTTSLASPSAIYIDAVNNRIGINVPVPTYPLDIDGDINVINAPATIRLAGDPVMQAGTGATKLGGTHGTITASDTAIGSGAMANASGVGAGGNTAIGLQAMGLSTAAENNTAVGALALDATQGVANVAVGVAAGLTNTTGSYNIFIGETADATAGNLTNAGAIGRGATIAQSNSLSIGGGIQGVGIKTATPKTTLDVGGSLAVFPVEVTLVNGLNSDVTTLVAAGMLRIVGPTGGFSVGGFSIPTGIPAVTGPTGGQVLYVFNSEAQQMTIVNEDLLSTDIKRIKTLTGGDVVLRAGTSAATFVYDDSVDRWLLMSSN